MTRVTIRQIAERAGVSRGTVDRVMNQRGRVSPEAEKKIRAAADELGYVHKARKKDDTKGRSRKIGVVTQLADSPFMMEINRGIQKATEELAAQGITVFLAEDPGVDESKQQLAMDSLVSRGICGLAIMPVDSNGIRQRINMLVGEKGIPVVTFNSDIVGTRRSNFVGMDNRRSGQTAAGLMGMLTRGTGKILIITGHFGSHVNNMRIEGFIEEIKKTCPDLELAGVHGSFDQAAEVEHIVKHAMMNIPGINGIFIVSGGQPGLGTAFRKLGLDKRPYVIMYDQTPQNEDMLKKGTADFLIDQNGYAQGYRAIHILADRLLKGSEPEQEHLFTDIVIKTKHNL